MQHTFFGKRRLMIAIGFCIVLLAATFTCAIGTSGDPQTTQQEKVNNLMSPQPAPLEGLFKFRLLNKDWNYWSNPPNLFAISTGNVGIGTTKPEGKLEVIEQNKAGLVVIPEDNAVVLGYHEETQYGGFTHYNLRLFRNQSGFASGVSIGGNYFGTAPEEGMTIHGNVGIGTTQPTAKLDVRGGNITVDGFPVCIFIGYAQQTTDITVSSTWTDITGASLNFTLPNAKYVDCRAFGSVPRPNFAIGFHFVIYNISYGDPSFGEMSSSGAGAWDPWYMERIVPLAAGSHNVKIQIRGEGYPFLYSNVEYFAARLLVQAW
jgi:hypothetical protein